MALKQSAIDLWGEVRYSKKRDKLKAKAKYIDDYHNMLSYPAFIHPSGKFAVIPDLKRFVFRPLLFWDNEHQESVMFIPSKQHNLEYAIIKDAAQNITTKVHAKFLYAHVWYTMEIVSEGCLDWAMLKSNISADLSADANLAAHTPILKRLEDSGTMRQLVAILMIGFAGYGMGVTTGLLGAMIIDYWW